MAIGIAHTSRSMKVSGEALALAFTDDHIHSQCNAKADDDPIPVDRDRTELKGDGIDRRDCLVHNSSPSSAGP